MTPEETTLDDPLLEMKLMALTARVHQASERYPLAAAAIASLDEENQHIVLLRLASKFNNGEHHFDHSDTAGAYSWLCLACAQSGRGPYFVNAGVMTPKETGL